MTDENLIDGSRDYDCCRYFDLIKRIDEFYADGIITTEELTRMGDMRCETLINYHVAQKLLKKMDPTAPDYGKLGELIDYLRRCWQTMSWAYDRGVQLHQNNPEDKKLSLNLNKEQADLLASILPKDRFAHKDIDKEPLKITPRDEEKAMGRVVRALKMLERDKMNRARAHMAETEHTKK